MGTGVTSVTLSDSTILTPSGNDYNYSVGFSIACWVIDESGI